MAAELVMPGRMRADAPTEVEAVPSTAALWPIAVAFVVVVTAPTPHAVFVASELVSPAPVA
jgi:hypothetical protein